MEHFTDEQWSDFVRGVGKRAQAIEAHLAEQCPECVAALAIWKQVWATAVQDRTYSPPENVVRLLEQEFRLRYPSEEPRARVLGKLIFDTLLQPLPMGVRGLAATARQMIYEAEGVSVDTHFAIHPRSKQVSIVGQVLRKAAPDTNVAGIAVRLLEENGGALLEATTNHLGEFHFEFGKRDRLQLSIEMKERPAIRIGLPDFVGKSNTGPI